MADDTPTVPSYASIFGGDTGLTYQELQRQRAIAQALQSKEMPYPKTIGEGIFSAAQSLAQGLDARRLDAMRQRQAAAEGGIVRGAPRTQYTPTGAPVAPVSPVPAASGTAPLQGGGSMTVTPPVPGAGTVVPQQRADITDALMNQYNPYAVG